MTIKTLEYIHKTLIIARDEAHIACDKAYQALKTAEDDDATESAIDALDAVAESARIEYNNARLALTEFENCEWR